MTAAAQLALESVKIANEKEARAALREFFSEVLRQDGPAELVRMFDAFYFKCHGEWPARAIQ